MMLRLSFPVQRELIDVLKDMCNLAFKFKEESENSFLGKNRDKHKESYRKLLFLIQDILFSLRSDEYTPEEIEEEYLLYRASLFSYEEIKDIDECFN